MWQIVKCRSQNHNSQRQNALVDALKSANDGVMLRQSLIKRVYMNIYDWKRSYVLVSVCIIRCKHRFYITTIEGLSCLYKHMNIYICIDSINRFLECVNWLPLITTGYLVLLLLLFSFTCQRCFARYSFVQHSNVNIINISTVSQLKKYYLLLYSPLMDSIMLDRVCFFLFLYTT